MSTQEIAADTQVEMITVTIDGFEVTVPKGAAEKSDSKSANSACVGLLIEHRISERQGFSQY